MWLISLRRQLERKLANDLATGKTVVQRMAMITGETLSAAIARLQTEISSGMKNFIATGNVTSASGLGLMQNTGLVIPADNINALRFAAHFRAVHRGAFFTEMRSSAVRRLAPEAWGFICPVHTPDGAPCGLLNHLTTHCRATVSSCLRGEHRSTLIGLLVSHGLQPVDSMNPLGVYQDLNDDEEEPVGQRVMFPVLLDGQFLGWMRGLVHVNALVSLLRSAKVTGETLDGVDIPAQLDIGWVPPAPGGAPGHYPGLFLNCGGARILRPVRHLASGLTEWIGTFEQPYLEIACLTSDLQPRSTHQELDPNTMFQLHVLAYTLSRS